MPRCAAVKNKKSELQCSAKAIGALALCGRHAKAKSVALWAVVNATKIGRIARFQALIRGWLVRRYLALCGPGVLCRKGVSNDEDVVTCEEKERQYPMDYFSFDENGKVWWFDFGTIWAWGSRSLAPTNPYTKVPLSIDVRRRLRAIWAYRRRNPMSMPSEQDTFQERLVCRWNVICQTLVDSGFVDVEPRMFVRFGKLQLITAFRFLRDDLRTSRRDPLDPQIMRCNRMINLCYNAETKSYMLQSAYMLMIMVVEHGDCYPFHFMLMSALYRC